MKAAVVRTLTCGPVWSSVRRTERPGSIAVFMYHEIGDAADDVDAWQVVRESDFLRQVDWLRREFRLISIDEAQREIVKGTVEARRAAVLTFDDGHRGLASRLLPVVRREGIPVAVYVSTGHIESGRAYWFDRVVNALQDVGTREVDLIRLGLGRFDLHPERGPLRWADIQRILVAAKKLRGELCEAVADEIDRQVNRPPSAVLVPLEPSEVAELSAEPLVTLGAHSHGHEVLTRLAPEACVQSILEGRALLERWGGRPVVHFAYPSGFHNAQVESAVRAAGFETAMATRPGLWGAASSPFAIPRIAVGRYDSVHQIGLNYQLSRFASGSTVA